MLKSFTFFNILNLQNYVKFWYGPEDIYARRLVVGDSKAYAV